MSKESKYFSARLKEFRGNRSQIEFADFLCIPQQSYSRYERGKIPAVEVLNEIAKKLNTTPMQLIGVNWGGQEIDSEYSAEPLVVTPLKESFSAFSKQETKFVEALRQLSPADQQHVLDSGFSLMKILTERPSISYTQSKK
jgi:transcriptional regulator with XRE-family HTH domain